MHRLATAPQPAPLRRALSLLAVLVVLLPLGILQPLSPAHAEGDKDDKIRQKADIDRQIEDIRGQLLDVDQDLSDTYLALARTELEIPVAQQALDDAQREAETARRADEDAQRRLDTAVREQERLEGEVQTGQVEVDRSDEEMKRISLDAYKGGGVPNPASVYLGSADPQDAVDRSMNYTLTLETQGTRLDDLRTGQSLTVNSADRLSAVRDEVADLRQEAADTLQAKIDAEAIAAQAKTDLDTLYGQQTQQKADLEAKKTQYEGDQQTLQDQSDGLDKEIDDLTRQEREAAKRGKPERVVPDNAGSGGGGVGPGGFQRPVPGPMNSTFGWRYHPIYHYNKLHAGNDFPVACGTPVHATQDGKVIGTTSGTAAGNKLIISHGVRGGKVITSSYHHLQRFNASVGQDVSRGDVVGFVGTTGSSTGCHLHFEIHEDGQAVDPARYV